jgi:hypothetical protein
VACGWSISVGRRPRSSRCRAPPAAWARPPLGQDAGDLGPVDQDVVGPLHPRRPHRRRPACRPPRHRPAAAAGPSSVRRPRRPRSPSRR